MPPEPTTFAPFALALGKEWIPKLYKRLRSIRLKRAEEIRAIKMRVHSVNPLELAKFYIEPNVQYSSSRLTPHSMEQPFPLRQQINHFIDANVTEQDGSHVLFLLGDAGMGKTSALVMLRLSHLVGFWPKDYDFQIFKLGLSTLDDLREVEDPTKTILLLDSLDEDPAAYGRVEERLLELLDATEVFKRVILTCRTQFFPQSENSPQGIECQGRVQVGGLPCNLVYLSLFDITRVDHYLHKRFPFWSWYRFVHRWQHGEGVRQRARRIVTSMHELRMRPLLLSYIEDLLSEQQLSGKSLFETYTALVDRWLAREVYKIRKLLNVILTPTELRFACEDLALHMLTQNLGAISIDHIDEHLGDSIRKKIQPVDFGGRSLLNRSSDGTYQFAHRTIAEYLALTRVLATVERPLPSGQTPLPLSETIHELLRERTPPVGCLTHLRQYLDGFELGGAELCNLDLSGAILKGAVLNVANLNESKLEGADLRRAKLRGANLKGVDFSGANLRDADVSNANLSGANLSGAELYGLDLSGADLNGVHLSETDLSGVDLSGVDLSGTNLSMVNLSNGILAKTDLSKADLRGAILESAELRGANLSRAILSEANLSQADLSGANLSDAEFRGSNLSGAIFDGARISGANFSNANLSETDLSEAKLRKTIFSTVNLSTVDLSGANLQGADLEKVDLRGAKLAGTDLSRTLLSQAELSGTDLTEANLSHAVLISADLSEASLNKAQLKHAVLSRAKLFFADLSETDLAGANLEGAFLSAANLSQANLSEANLDEANLSGANLSGAKLGSTRLTQAQLEACLGHPTSRSSDS